MSLFGKAEPSPPARRPRPRPALAEEPAAIYAIGDVHGHLDLLLAIEAMIVEDAASVAGDKCIVMLGDYVDRGPQSRQAIEHLLAPPPAGFARYCLCGNHEAAMLDFLDRPGAGESWLGFGGMETLASYGVDMALLTQTPAEIRRGLAAAIPATHRAFLMTLAAILTTPRHIFVHAGLRPHVPLPDQSERDLLWIRDYYRGTYAEFGRTVVHGHTPRETALVTPSRIAIDTGAFFSGQLTAVRLSPGRAPKLLQTR